MEENQDDIVGFRYPSKINWSFSRMSSITESFYEKNGGENYGHRDGVVYGYHHHLYDAQSMGCWQRLCDLYCNHTKAYGWILAFGLVTGVVAVLCLGYGLTAGLLMPHEDEVADSNSGFSPNWFILLSVVLGCVGGSLCGLALVMPICSGSDDQEDDKEPFHQPILVDYELPPYYTAEMVHCNHIDGSSSSQTPNAIGVFETDPIQPQTMEYSPPDHSRAIVQPQTQHFE